MKLEQYPKYKESGIPWVGAVPDSWTVNRAKWYIKSPKELNSNEQCKQVLSLTLRGVVDNDPENPEGLVPKDYKTYQIFEKDDLVFKLIDLENVRTSRAGLVHKRGIMSPAYIRASVNKGNNSKYFYYLYYSWYLQNVYNKLGAGVRATLSAKDLLDLPITLPTQEEQIAIASFIRFKERKIAQFIRNKRRLIQSLKEQKQIIINQAVTQGIDPNAKMKPSGVDWIGDIPVHWECYKLKRIARFNPSKAELGNNVDMSTVVIFLPMEKVSVDGKIDCTEKRKVSEIWNGFTYFKRGDVVVAKITPCFENGKGAYIDHLESEFGFGTTEFVVIRPSEMLCGEFLYYITVSSKFRKDGEEVMTGAAGQKRVSTDFIKNYLIALPSTQEQLKIVDFIKKKHSEIDRVINRTNREIELIQEYRTRLISDVVTGKVDVRNIKVEDVVSDLSPTEGIEELEDSVEEVPDED